MNANTDSPRVPLLSLSLTVRVFHLKIIFSLACSSTPSVIAFRLPSSSSSSSWSSLQSPPLFLPLQLLLLLLLLPFPFDIESVNQIEREGKDSVANLTTYSLPHSLGRRRGRQTTVAPKSRELAAAAAVSTTTSTDSHSLRSSTAPAPPASQCLQTGHQSHRQQHEKTSASGRRLKRHSPVTQPIGRLANAHLSARSAHFGPELTHHPPHRPNSHQ